MNLIPTVILILTQGYWIITSLGLMDMDALDVDMDLEGDGGGILGALAAFMNVGGVPVALALTLAALNFWILMMLTYFLPITAGGLVSGVLMGPALAAGLYGARFEIAPLRKRYFERTASHGIGEKVLNKRCRLLSALEYGRMGQAEIRQEGASLVLNVMPQFENEVFEKDEYAFVCGKDKHRDLYYVSKLIMGSDFYKQLEEN